MAEYKVLFTGSVASGKTTAIKSLSDIETVDTDTGVSDSAIRRKQKTTIAMDYGLLELSDTSRLHLYGTPGQERFKFMWQLMMSDLVHDAVGLVMLVDNTRNDPFKDIRFYLEEFRDFIVRRRLIIAVTHSDVQANPDKSVYDNVLKEMGVYTSVMFIDARDPESVLTVVKELIGDSEPDIDWAAQAKKLEANSTVSEELTPDEAEEEVSLLDAATNTRGITAAMHLGREREVISSNVEDKTHRQLLQSMVSLVAVLESKASFLGCIDNLVLCGPKEQTLSVFAEEHQALGLSAEKEVSISVLKQQARDLLQWSGSIHD